MFYFNTNKPRSFFWQNTSSIEKPQVISGLRGGNAYPLPLAPSPPPLMHPWKIIVDAHTELSLLFERCVAHGQA